MGQFHLAISPMLKSDRVSISRLKKWKSWLRLLKRMGAMDTAMPRWSFWLIDMACGYRNCVHCNGTR